MFIKSLKNIRYNSLILISYIFILSITCLYVNNLYAIDSFVFRDSIAEDVTAKNCNPNGILEPGEYCDPQLTSDGTCSDKCVPNRGFSCSDTKIEYCDTYNEGKKLYQELCDINKGCGTNANCDKYDSIYEANIMNLRTINHTIGFKSLSGCLTLNDKEQTKGYYQIKVGGPDSQMGCVE